MVNYSATTKYHEFLSAITEHAAEGILAYSKAGSIILANPAAGKIFGLDNKDMEKCHIQDLVPPGQQYESVLGFLLKKDPLNKSPSIEFEGFKPDGSIVPLDILLGNATLSDGEEILIANCRDITDQRETEARLMQQAEIIRKMHDAVIVADANMKMTSCNSAVKTMLGLSDKDLIGKSIYEVADISLPDGLDGEELRARALEDTRWNGIVEITNRAGETFITDTLLFPMLGEDGEVGCFISVVRDIGDRVENEKRIQETQRIESLGRLAGGVAHDINNLLFPIFLNLEDAVDSIEDGDDLEGACEQIRASMEACIKIKKMIEQILHFSRDTSTSREDVDLSAAILDAWGLTKMIVPSSYDIKVDIDEDCGLVHANSIQFSQILLNLVANGVAAQDPYPGKLEISLKRVHGSAVKETRYYRIRDIEYAVLTVTDEGCGIPEEIIDNIFDPFFTTKDVGQGTGLGLTEVAGIIRDFDGAIDIDSVVDKGTSMSLFFPIKPTVSPVKEECVAAL